MRILQISFGDQIEERLECVETVLDGMAEAGDEYVLIGDVNIGKGFISTEEYEQKLSDENPFLHNIYQKANYENRSDIIRVHYSSQNEDVLYLDTDVLLYRADTLLTADPWHSEHFNRKAPWRDSLRRLSKKLQLPCFCPAGRSSMDFYVMYNGTYTLFFKQWVDWLVHHALTAPELTRGWPCQYIIRENRKRTTLPRVTGFYDHLADHKRKPRMNVERKCDDEGHRQRLSSSV